MPTPLPDADPECCERLDLLAQNMIAEATSVDNSRILSANGFAHENISILHQQIRATNLAWALGRTGRVKPGDTIAIVGGSFSGMTLAVVLALVNDAIVLIFEKDSELLERFRNKSHRHLSRNLNSRSLGKAFDPYWSSPEFRSPIFAWAAGPASKVAASWIEEFGRYEARLPIFVIPDITVTPASVISQPEGLAIDLSVEAPHLKAVPVDLLIDATGFGAEANPLGVTDHSYWEAGHRLIYDHLVPPARVLISGCGDSGVIEGWHYALNGFEHRKVESFWQPGVRLEAVLDEGLARARLDAIFRNEEAWRYERPVLSEVCWWLDQRYFMENNPQLPWPPGGEPHVRPIFEALEAALAPHFAAWRPGGDIAATNWDALEDFVLGLELGPQFEAREAARLVGDVWVSRLIEELAQSIQLPETVRPIEDLARPGIDVVLNGLTPTPYTRQLSAYNVWLMRLLRAFPAVDYRQGAISAVVQRPDRRFDVNFADGDTEIFDRVVTRYGPAAGGGSGIAHGQTRDTQGGDWLLAEPYYLAHDSDGATHGRYIYPARAEIVAGLEALDGRPNSEGIGLSKELFVASTLIKGAGVQTEDLIYRDPQTWLAAELRAGRRPSYTADAAIARANIRGR